MGGRPGGGARPPSRVSTRDFLEVTDGSGPPPRSRPGARTCSTTRLPARAGRLPCDLSELNLIMLGPAGRRQGHTGRAACARTSRLVHIATGDMLRAEVAGRQRARQRRRSATWTPARLVPDEVIVGNDHQSGSQGPTMRGAGFLLDGFPRNAEQGPGARKMRLPRLFAAG